MIDTKKSYQYQQALGARVTEAREAAGLHVTNLAELISVSRTALTNYENGTSPISEESLYKISHILGQPLSFFYDTNFDGEFSHELVHYRDMTSNRMYMRAQAGVRLKWLIEYFALIEQDLKLPEANLPDLNPPNDVVNITDAYVEQAASELRTLWQLGDKPIGNLIHVMELNGCVISQTCLDLPHLDGLSFWSNSQNRPFILLNSDKASAVRSRFDVAHELGHMLLHRNIPAQRRGSKIYKRMEQQAHNFASALLLPQTSWLPEVKRYMPKKYTLAPLKTLKPKWKVSIKAQIMRLDKLGELDEQRKKSLFTQYSNRGWNKAEPFDDIWQLETPRLFAQATELLVTHGLDANHLLEKFPRRLEHLCEITGLPKSFFDKPALVEKRMLN